VAGLGDSWYFSSPYYYVEYTPYVKEMSVRVEGYYHYTKDVIALYDNTGTGGSSWDFFSVALEGIGIVFTAYDIYDWLAKIYQQPPDAEWEGAGHWSRAITRQKTEPAWNPPGGGRWVDPNGPLLKTSSANLWGYFEEGSSYILSVTAQAEIYVQSWSLNSNYVHHIYVGTYSVSFEVSLNPVCAMKTGTDGYFYVPICSPSLLKIEMLFDDTLVGDQTGGTSPYTDISDYPDTYVEMMDFFVVNAAFGSQEGSAKWNYMADVNSDGYIELMDSFVISQHYGNHGTYITNLSTVTVTFDTGDVSSPDSNGFINHNLDCIDCLMAWTSKFQT